MPKGVVPRLPAPTQLLLTAILLSDFSPYVFSLHQPFFFKFTLMSSEIIISIKLWIMTYHSYFP